MNTLYCDLCNAEIPPLQYHDFPQSVNINGVGGDYYRKSFEVCDKCKSIWNNEADIFINRVKKRCKGMFTRESLGSGLVVDKIKPDWFTDEMEGYNSIQEVKKQRNPTLQAIIDWLNKK